ncbi:MAG: HAD family hydrolase [Patescibacteria group bacterium]|nr:HAD family hydrolase [Patescibacteria group bacterium]MDE2438143.1 HAD family hydrolase [Patescibacteria group bacterium]
MIKLIIFDYDGVILDSFPAIHRVYLNICKTLGIPCPEDLEEFRKVYGKNYKECLSNLGVTDEQVVRQAEEMYVDEIKTQKYNAYPNIQEVLRELHQNYTLVVLSSNYANEIRRNLELNQLDSFFDDVVGKTDLTRFIKKNVVPDILNRFNVGVDEVIMIGDRNVDYTMARENNIRHFILAHYGWGYDPSTIDPETPIAHNTLDLLTIISGIDSPSHEK